MKVCNQCNNVTTIELVLFHLHTTRGGCSTTIACNMILGNICIISQSHNQNETIELIVQVTAPTCAWKRDSDLAVCSGMSTFMRNCLCSAFRGNANPLIILQTQNTRRVQREIRNTKKKN